MTDQEIAAQDLVPAGQYQFEVLEASEQISKTGNPMIKLKLKIWTNDGKERVIFDYILAAFARKLKHFCIATHQQDKYDQGNLQASDCIFKMGKLDLGIEVGKPNPNGGLYPDKNTVLDYVIETAAAPQANAAQEVPFNDDVPF